MSDPNIPTTYGSLVSKSHRFFVQSDRKCLWSRTLSLAERAEVSILFYNSLLWYIAFFSDHFLPNLVFCGKWVYFNVLNRIKQHAKWMEKTPCTNGLFSSASVMSFLYKKAILSREVISTPLIWDQYGNRWPYFAYISRTSGDCCE